MQQNALSKFFFGLAAVFFMIWLLLPLLFKSTSGDPDNVYDFEESKGPWAVDGVRVGASYEECRRILGGNDRPAGGGPYGKKVRQWPQPADVMITFGADDKAVDILGRTLTGPDGKAVVGGWEGMDGVKAILKSAKIEKHYRPKGSGVINFSSVCDAVTFRVKDANGNYSVYFYEGTFRNVRGWK